MVCLPYLGLFGLFAAAVLIGGLLFDVFRVIQPEHWRRRHHDHLDRGHPRSFRRA